MSDITAIPTKYRGVQFRSRLEACWASFFDRMGWQWEYEPIDMPGWIPDFLLLTQSRKFLVEIKPAVEFDQLTQYWTKIERASPEIPVLLLGARIFQEVYESMPEIRVLGQVMEFACGACGSILSGPNQDCPIGCVAFPEASAVPCGIGKCRDCERIGFTAIDDLNGLGLSSCCSKPAYDGFVNHPGISIDGEANQEIWDKWTVAKNLVQWNPPRPPGRGQWSQS